MPLPSESAQTLVEAMHDLRTGEGRGFYFVGRDRKERFFPYEELLAEAKRRAGFLAGLGLTQGDRAAIVVGEPHEFVLTFLGCVVAGVIPAPIFPRASFKNAESYIETLAHIMGTAGAKVAFCMEGNRDIVEQAAGRVEGLKLVGVETAFEGDGGSAPTVTIGPEDLCFLQFTSGSTSKPKGVMVTHANLVANARSFLGPAGLDRTDDDLGVTWLPLFHDMGLIGFVLGTLVCDIPVIILPTELFARSPGLWLQTISDRRGTITFAPNFAYQLVTRRIKERQLAELDLSSLRIAGCGAEPIRARTLQAFADKFSPAKFDEKAFLPSYGMAEATLAITFHPRNDAIVVDRIDPETMKAGRAEATDKEDALEVISCGVGFPDHDVKVVDDEGGSLPERSVGQVVARGPSITAGYFENPEASAEGWKDGWLQTGDLGYFAEGALYICGRIKDLIIIRGANHYPQDIEWAVGDLEGVRRGNVCAFSVMKDGTEELIVSAEAGRADAERLREEIPRVVRQSFGLVPADVVLTRVGTLPKTSSGKTQRRKTRAMYENGELGGHA